MSDLTERKLKACQVKTIDKIPYEQELQVLKQQYEILRDKLEKEHNYRKTTEHLFSQLSSDYAELEKRDKMWSELAENLLCLEENKWQDLVENGTKEQRIEFLKEKEEHCLLGAIDKISKLKSEKDEWAYECGVSDAKLAKLQLLIKECYNILTRFLVNGVEPKDEEIIIFLTKIELELKCVGKNS